MQTQVFDYLVDTVPMAESVDTMSAHVGATTAAVAAMETAVILTEKESADNICKNIDKGFYCLITSQVTTKRAKSISELRARFVQLQQMAKSLNDKHLRMEEDVARLKREYGAIFSSINKSLDHRISELDKFAYRLAENRRTLITQRALKCVPEIVCAEQESGNVQQMTYAARLKSKTSKAIERITENILQSESYKEQVSDVLSDTSTENAFGEYIPVLLVTEKNIAVSDSSAVRLYVPEGIQKECGREIERAVLNDEESLQLSLPDEKDKLEIRKAFQLIVNDSGVSGRVYNRMMDLFIQGGH